MQKSFYPYCGNMCDGAVFRNGSALLHWIQPWLDSRTLKRSTPAPPTLTSLHYKEANIRNCYTLMISDTDLEFNKGWKPFSQDSPRQDLSFLFIRWKCRRFPGPKMKTRRLPLGSERHFNLCISIFWKAPVFFFFLSLRLLRGVVKKKEDIHEFEQLFVSRLLQKSRLAMC